MYNVPGAESKYRGVATVNLNFDNLRGEFAEIMRLLEQQELWLRPIMAELSGEMAHRIHIQGTASDGSKIGSYSSAYLRQRAKNKLGSDANVVLVFSRKMSNSWGVFATDRGWAVGFVDDSGSGGFSSLDKLHHVEKLFGKKIQDMTEQETAMVNERVTEIINELLSQYGRT